MEQLLLQNAQLKIEITRLKRQHLIDLKRYGLTLICIQNNIHHISQLLEGAELQYIDEKYVYLTPPDHILVKLLKFQFFNLNIGLDQANFETYKIPKTTVDRISQEITNIFTTNTPID